MRSPWRYNVPGVDTSTLTPEVIAGIFNSSITKWNDKAIADAQPGATLPDAPIAQFHRCDESGTTANFTNYLDRRRRRRLDLRGRQGVGRARAVRAPRAATVSRPR